MTEPTRELFMERVVNGTGDSKTMTDIYHINVDDPYTAEQLGPAYKQSYGTDLFVTTKKAIRLKTKNGWCELTVIYKTKDATTESPYESSWDIDMTSQTHHITSVENPDDQDNYNYEGMNKESANVGTAIGIAGNQIKGCDIYVATGSYTHRQWISQAQIASTMTLIGGLRTRVNDANWKYWKKGEVLFLGGSFSQTGNDMVQVTYEFLISENASDIELEVLNGDGVSNGKYPSTGYLTTATIPTKRGWEYLWYLMAKIPLYLSGSDQKPQKTVEVIKSAHVAKTYKEGDFATLGLGA